jgi:hypothetical protein
MIKRRYFSAVAVALLAGLAFVAPAQASSTLVTQMVTFGSRTNTTVITEIDFTYTGALTISNVSDGSNINAFAKSGSAFNFVNDTVTQIAPNEIALKFAPGATIATGSFSFESSKTYSAAPGITVSVKTVPAGHQGLVTGHMLSFAPYTVPEPSSMALLGIGMTSFLAFRRFFKRTPLA